MTETAATWDILARLVAFETLTDRPNLGLIDYVEATLRACGAEVARFAAPCGDRAGLFARLGPALPGGVVLSAHSDVVPAAGQTWTRPPFRMTREGDRLYGRGTTDMKGALAAMIAAFVRAKDAPRPGGGLNAPLMLALTYDEEIGCQGMAAMAPWLAPRVAGACAALVGEPTSLAVATAHKGKRAWRADFRGQAGHSALAPGYVSALHMGADFLGALRALQDDLATPGDTTIAYPTVHVGTFQAGDALNLVPETAEMAFELRTRAAHDAHAIANQIAQAAQQVETRYRARFPAARVTLTPGAAYPALAIAADPPWDTGACAWAAGAAPAEKTITVPFGTEAGFFAQMGLPTVVCGPGSMAEAGHQP
ncbi:MAG: M20/M25/M40 family metallo-hydrolase, partial [Pseudomonadota bacterium]